MSIPFALRHTLIAASLAMLSACGGGESATAAPAPTPAPTPAPSPVTPTACPSPILPLNQAEIDEATFMREEEKLARDVYQDLAAYWQAQAGNVPVVTVMSNIVKAENQHMESMKNVLVCYGLPDPINPATPSGVFLDPELAQLYVSLMARGKTSQMDALKVGGLIEEVDIEDLQRSIEISQQAYTDEVYAALMCVSRNHLRSFAGQLIKTQGKYTAQLLPQATVDAIVNSPNETCGDTTGSGSSGNGGGNQGNGAQNGKL